MAKTKEKDLDKMLQADRKKRANQSGKGANAKGVVAIPTGPRAGIQKRKNVPQPPASLNGKWTHDLHASVSNTREPRPTKVSKSTDATNGAKAPIVISQKVAKKLASNRLFEALHGAGDAGKPTASDLGVNIRGAAKPKNINGGITIKGSAGPFAVQGSNFAPGTTASDIRSILEKFGLSPINCGILSANPTVIAEFLFETREEAERCVEMFNNKLGDNRLLHFMIKDTPQLPIPTKPRGHLQTQAQPVVQQIPTGPKGGASHVVIDGKYGFSAPRNAGSGLYSDAMVASGGSRRQTRGRNQGSTR
ncbi:hypothetical protein TWF106_003850 [Orbilia oligospora]|uniref:RRM domain-containing protein n=1 Tax=Orbilia oligospora TaxID=2813651 RepID=A0A6G1M4G3_ORBOL|nr:hypothetical protein TWF788_011151 [Orbilia oligospora]KAF3199357.1 hypothetical protein TWF106_003850 [Orbilia oligospora]KAF3216492.1 hypothetical protein TWF191_008980 [Orbilia oligospora]KAF3223602.1 hypothetical protein TWF679_000048 [Orbilia oligospora]KAF3245001.1 hypothetical protein TWF192_007525 [Orbilia oligospora]